MLPPADNACRVLPQRQGCLLAGMPLKGVRLMVHWPETIDRYYLLQLLLHGTSRHPIPRNPPAPPPTELPPQISFLCPADCLTLFFSPHPMLLSLFFILDHYHLMSVRSLFSFACAAHMFLKSISKRQRNRTKLNRIHIPWMRYSCERNSQHYYYNRQPWTSYEANVAQQY